MNSVASAIRRPRANADMAEPVAARAAPEAHVFISYSRRDAVLVRKLNDAFAAKQRNAWVDWEDIPPSAEWWKEIEAGIERSDAFLCMLSPNFLRSDVCMREVQHAVQHRKRIIPVVHEDVDVASVPPALAALNWIFLRRQDDFARSFALLLQAIDTDLDWVRAHSHWLARAIEWDSRGQDRSLLLRGSVLNRAEAWLSSAGAHQEPAPTALQTAYIIASRQSATRAQRRTQIVTSVTAIVLLAVAAFAWYQRNEKELQRVLAVSREMAARASAELTNNRELSVLLALQAMNTARTRQAEDALANAVLAYPHRIALKRNTGPLSSAAFSPDGKRVITSGKDGSARQSAADSGDLLTELSGLDGSLSEVAFSPDGSFLLGRGKAVRVWNAETLELVSAGLGGDGEVFSAKFSPSGKWIVLAHGNGTASVWQTHTGRKLLELRGHAGTAVSAVFSPDETSIATAGHDGIARIWNAASGQLIAELKGHTHRLSSAEFSPDGRHLLTVASPFAINAQIAAQEQSGVITGGRLVGGRLLGSPQPDNTARIWDLRTGRSVAVLRVPGQPILHATFAPGGNAVAMTMLGRTMLFSTAGHPIGQGFDGRLASFSPDGRFIATIEGRETVRIRRMASYETVGIFPGEIVRFSPDSRRVLAASADGSVFIWNVDRDTGLRQSTEEFPSASFSKDGAMVVTIDREQAARLWDGRSGVEVTATKAPDLSIQPIRAAAFGGDELLTLDSYGRATLRNLANGKQVRLDSPSLIDSAEISPDGRRVLTRSQKGRQAPGCDLNLWNSDTGEKVAEICLTDEKLPHARFSPDSAWILTTTSAGPQIWDGRSGRRVADLPGANSFISAASLSWVATSQSGDSVPIWEAHTGRPVTRLKAYTGSTSASSTVAKFSADGSLVMTIGRPIRLWDPSTGRQLAEFNGSDAVFSPDGRMVASVDIARNDMAARVWDARTGKRLAEAQHGEVVQAVAFSPDGRWLVTTGRNSVRIFEASTGRMLRHIATSGQRVASATLAPGTRWLVVKLQSDGGPRVQLHPWERFAPTDDLVDWARTLVARTLDAQEMSRYVQE